MACFEVILSANLNLTSYSGLVLFGLCSETRQEGVIEPNLQLSQGVKTSNLVMDKAGLLSLGKIDFEAIDPLRLDRFLVETLGMSDIKSVIWARQRLDDMGAELRDLSNEFSLRLLVTTKISIHQKYRNCSVRWHQTTNHKRSQKQTSRPQILVCSQGNQGRREILSREPIHQEIRKRKICDALG
jgi:hypothetical protein